MRERREVGLPDPVQQFAERRVAVRPGPHHQRVDEEPEQVLQRLVGATRDRRADGDVGPRPQPGQQRRDTGLDHHELRRVRAARHLVDGPVQLGVQAQRCLVAEVGRHRRARVVGRQLDLLRQAAQGLGPERHLPVDRAVPVVHLAEQFPLPQRVIRVLHRQRLEHRCRAAPTSGIGGGEVVAQQRFRPAVADDVVHQGQQRVSVAAQAEQRRADRQLGGDVEVVPRRLAQCLRQLRFVDLDHFKHRPRLLRRQYDLVRNAVVLRKKRPQRLVLRDDVSEGRAQGGDVQIAGQPQDQRHVVGRAGAFQPRQEPQALLHVRQRHPFRTRHRPQRHSRALRAVQALGESRDRWRLKQRAQRQLRAEGRTDTADQPGDQQRVAAEVEETVVDADPGDLQHVPEQPAQDLLALVARGAATGQRGQVRGGQRLAVQLSVGGQRQRVQLHHDRGHHVLRQRRCDPTPHIARIDRFGGDDVADQALVAGLVLPDDHRGLGHRRVRQHLRLDLAQFDPEAADLDLVVGPAEVFQHALVVPPHQIAAAVHPGAGSAERVGDEPVCR